MKRQALVIGLGQFGLALARSLSASGVEVLAVDVLPERVQVAADAVSQAICCDAMDEEAL
ncbi:MAG TPA: TrkA family potassium uptake protein, partial [Planctomycetes bacterium]|nr:TrkA family potassium uptake protein [Planctomycetota bacterium]